MGQETVIFNRAMRAVVHPTNHNIQQNIKYAGKFEPVVRSDTGNRQPSAGIHEPDSYAGKT